MTYYPTNHVRTHFRTSYEEYIHRPGKRNRQETKLATYYRIYRRHRHHYHFIAISIILGILASISVTLATKH